MTTNPAYGTEVPAGTVTTTAGGATSTVTLNYIDYTDGLKLLVDAIDRLTGAVQAITPDLGTAMQDFKDGAASFNTGADKFNTGADKFNTGADKFNTGADTLKEGGTAIKTGGESMVTASDTTSAAMSSMEGEIKKQTSALWRNCDLKDLSMQTGNIVRNISLAKAVSTGPERLIDIQSLEAALSSRTTLPFPTGTP